MTKLPNTEFNTPFFQDVTMKLTPSLADLPKIPKHLINAQLSWTRPRFSDLDSFRQEIEQSKAGLHHQPYTNNKKSVFHYRLTFFFLALLFAFLGFLAMKLSSIAGNALFIPTTSFVKGGICTICFLLSTCSFAIALAIRAERETILQCIRKAKAMLSAIYARKRLRIGMKRFFAFYGQHGKIAVALKHAYDEALDRINNKKDEALHLIHRIATATTLNMDEKEALFNQAAEELNEKLMTLTHTFRQASLPHYPDK